MSQTLILNAWKAKKFAQYISNMIAYQIIKKAYRLLYCFSFEESFTNVLGSSITQFGFLN